MAEWDTEVDFLAIGAGGCGLSAAALEKLELPGGNTALSTGSVPGAGTRLQRAGCRAQTQRGSE